MSSEPRAVPVAMQSMIDWMHWIFTVALKEADVRQLRRACAGREELDLVAMDCETALADAGRTGRPIRVADSERVPLAEELERIDGLAPELVRLVYRLRDDA